MTDGTDVETSCALAEGIVVGRYIVGKPIGSGAMGRVYAAYDPELDRKVAIKVLREHVAGGTDLDSRVARNRRLQREAQAIAKLTHPNIVKVHDVGSIGADGQESGRVVLQRVEAAIRRTDIHPRHRQVGRLRHALAGDPAGGLQGWVGPGRRKNGLPFDEA